MYDAHVYSSEEIFIITLLSLCVPSPQLVDYRVEFSKWWVTEFKHIKFPSQGTIFDYYLDHETRKWVSWSEMVPKFQLDPDIPLQVPSMHPFSAYLLLYVQKSE